MVHKLTLFIIFFRLQSPFFLLEPRVIWHVAALLTYILIQSETWIKSMYPHSSRIVDFLSCGKSWKPDSMKDFLEILPSDPIGCEYDQFAYVTTLFFYLSCYIKLSERCLKWFADSLVRALSHPRFLLEAIGFHIASRECATLKAENSTDMMLHDMFEN